MTSAGSAPRIKSLAVRAARVPLPEPHTTASGTVAESPLVLTDVLCDDGSVGHSLLFTYTPAALKPTAELVRNLEPLVAGSTRGAARHRAVAGAPLPPARLAGTDRHGDGRDRHGAVGRAGAPRRRLARAAAGRDRQAGTALRRGRLTTA